MALGQLEIVGEVGEVSPESQVKANSLSEAGKSFRSIFLRVPERGAWNLAELILGREVLEQML